MANLTKEEQREICKSRGHSWNGIQLYKKYMTEPCQFCGVEKLLITSEHPYYKDFIELAKQVWDKIHS